MGTTRLGWRSLDPSATDVRKGIIKTRILTGTYLLQKHRHSFSGGIVDPVCQLEDKDLFNRLLHMLARCPAFFKSLFLLYTLADARGASKTEEYTFERRKEGINKIFIVVHWRQFGLETWKHGIGAWHVNLRNMYSSDTSENIKWLHEMFELCL